MFRRLAPGLLLLGSVLGQEPPDATIRITVNLVQVDAVVTDSKGRQVPGLEAKDFEVLQDGTPQKITHCSYISIASAPANHPPRPIALAPAAALDPSQVQRAMALVVDDLGLSFESMARVRGALRQFVDRQMQPGDLVAIVHTGGGMGVLQQFTSDKRLLYAAITHAKYNALSRDGIKDLTVDPLGNSAGAGLAKLRAAQAQLDEQRETSLALGTVGAIRFVVNGLKEFPGRKSVVLFSESMRLLTRERGPLADLGIPGTNQTVLDSLESLGDLCSRNSVVIYTLDPRGVVFQGFTAADQSSAERGDAVAAQLAERSQDFSNTQEGLNFLARETGGLFIHNTNDLNAGLGQILDDQSGYYLIGYAPDSSTFEEKSGRPLFRKITIRVNRGGLRVRTRSGFYGIPDHSASLTRRTRGEQLLAALNSPFNASGIHVRFTPLFANSEKEGSFIDSLVYVEARDLEFDSEPDDWHQAALDVAIAMLGDTGDEVSRQFHVRLQGEEFQSAIRNGLLFRLHDPLKKPGVYQLRCAVQDDASGRLGSARQFIEAPDLTRGRLALSSLVVNGPVPRQSKPANPEHAVAIDPLESPVLRTFRPGGELSWAVSIFNARRDAATHLPRVALQLRMFHNGKEVYTGKPWPLPPERQADMTHIFAGGRLRLGARMEPGDYILQVVATDNLAKTKYGMAIQWMDFEIRP